MLFGLAASSSAIANDGWLALEIRSVLNLRGVLTFRSIAPDRVVIL
jgi:hypothetical protein